MRVAGKQGYVFGPVPSRRLGLSLGIDPVPMKTCSMNCVYCELGPTTDLTVERKCYADVDAILAEARERLSSCRRLDYVTLSGSGEPTLHSGIPDIVRGLRRMTDAPIAVLTNASLLSEPDVAAALDLADVVLPSLDAVSTDAFRAVNRPHESLDPSRIVRALARFGRESRVAVWLETLFVSGLNDDDCEVALLREAIEEIRPERVHVNTVVRPPAHAGVRPVRPDALERIASTLGPRAEIIAAPPSAVEHDVERNADEIVIAMAARRPVTVSDVACALGTTHAEAEKILALLVGKRALTLVSHDEKLYHKA